MHGDESDTYDKRRRVRKYGGNCMRGILQLWIRPSNRTRHFLLAASQMILFSYCHYLQKNKGLIQFYGIVILKVSPRLRPLVTRLPPAQSTVDARSSYMRLSSVLGHMVVLPPTAV